MAVVFQSVNVLNSLVSALLVSKSPSEKIALLRRSSHTVEFLDQALFFEEQLNKASLKTQLIILAVLAVGEGPIVFRGWQELENLSKAFETIAEMLQPVESFYDVLGGIVGYHTTFLKLIEEKETLSKGNETFQEPPWIDITQGSLKVKQAIRSGIEKLPELAEIYPIGGAGDRLNLIDPTTGEPLPAAILPFCGNSLLELLLRDLEAREFLYEKLYGEEVTTPVVLMTSHEKNNDEMIRKIFEEKGWFGRPKESFYFVIQPRVPVLTEEGHWVMRDIFHPCLKPGGHGVLWKLIRDQGGFHWLKKLGRKKALVRQINNPIAGTDYGLLAFLGLGCREDKVFGFASCPRLLHAAEGMNVLVEKKEKEEYHYSLSNIEYTEFLQKGVEEVPAHQDSPYSRFPANTNILFVDLAAIERTIPLCPVPGMLINLKNEVTFTSAEGESEKKKGGRLESTMQNISDVIVSQSSSQLNRGELLNHLSVFLTYGEREKTISVAKCSYKDSGKILETPEGCFYQMMQNQRELLITCGMQVPEGETEEDYLLRGPSLLFLFHPALGPLYQIIQQKIRGGKVGKETEMQIEIAEVDLVDLDLKGSLLIQGDLENSRCSLRQVRVINQGIDREAPNVYWSNTIARKEALRIILEGTAEFQAENVVFHGDQEIRVPSGVRCIAYQEEDKVLFREEKIQSPSWTWGYCFDEQENICLSKMIF